MATITFTITAPGGPFTHTFTVPNAELARAVVALRAQNATVAAPLSTDDAAAQFWFGQCMNSLRDVTRRIERDAAHNTAVNAVTDITYT